jgi:hypothetical protein
MDAIYRVDGNRVVTSPRCCRILDASMQYGSAPQSLLPAANAECHQSGPDDFQAAGAGVAGNVA